MFANYAPRHLIDALAESGFVKETSIYHVAVIDAGDLAQHPGLQVASTLAVDFHKHLKSVLEARAATETSLFDRQYDSVQQVVESLKRSGPVPQPKLQGLPTSLSKVPATLLRTQRFNKDGSQGTNGVVFDLDGCTPPTLANIRDTVSQCVQTMSNDHAIAFLGLERLTTPNAHVLQANEPIAAHHLSLGLLINALQQQDTAPDQVCLALCGIRTAAEAKYYAELLKYVQDKVQTKHPQCSVLAVVSFDHVICVDYMSDILFELQDFVFGAFAKIDTYMSSVLDFHSQLPCSGLSQFDPCPTHIYRRTLAFRKRVAHTVKQAGGVYIGNLSGFHHDSSDAHPDVSSLIEMEYSLGATVFVGTHAKSLLQALAVVPHEEKEVDAGASLVDCIQSPFAGHSSPSVAEFERALAYLYQSLAFYISGEGIVRLNGTDFTTDTMRRVWSYVRYALTHADKLQLSNGEALSAENLSIYSQRAFNRICNGFEDTKRTVHNKLQFDFANTICNDVLFRCSAHKWDSMPRDFMVAGYRYLVQPFLGEPGVFTRCDKRAAYPFLKYPNLSPECTIEFTTNEAFAPASSLLKTTFPAFQPHFFGPEGQVYDGWETARHNINPPDYVVLVLKQPAIIHGVNVDTAHFDGNHVIGCRVEGLVEEMLDHQRRERKWVELVPKSLLQGNSRHLLASTSLQPVVKIKLLSYPDGGIARFETFGEYTNIEKGTMNSPLVQQYIERLAQESGPGFPANFQPDLVVEIRESPDDDHKDEFRPESEFKFPGLTCLAMKENGGEVIASSSAHYSSPANMIKTRRAFNMGDGWETKRLRSVPQSAAFDLTTPVIDPFNWTIIKLGKRGKPKEIVIDTLHFKNNPPVACCVETCDADITSKTYFDPKVTWTRLIKPTRVYPCKEHHFTVESSAEVSHVMIKIFPCGGISRVRVYC